MNFEYLTSIKDLKDFQQELSSSDKLYLDIETTGLDFFLNDIILVQIKTRNKIFVFNALTLGTRYITYIMELIQDRLVIGHNIKFDVKFLYAKTHVLLKNVHCTMNTEVLLNLGVGKQYYSLKELVEKYLGIEINKEVREEFYTNFNGNVTQEQLIYSATDVNYLEEIYNQQLAEVDKKLLAETLNLENRLLPVIVSMETTGVILDQEKWLKLAKESEAKMILIGEELRSRIIEDVIKNLKYENALDIADKIKIREGAKNKRDRKLLETITEVEFVKEFLKNNLNLNSSTQLLEILNLVYNANLKNTNEKTLVKAQERVPIIKRIIDYREFAKSVSAFGENYLKNIHSKDNRIHTEYNQVGTVTGRMSSEQPNLQNIKKEAEYRSCFIPAEGYKFICADYSQQEYRILAWISADENLRDLFMKGIDPHTGTASLLFKIPPEEITKDQRSKGKTLNFAVVYGTSIWGLKRNFGVSLEEAEAYLQGYYSIYSQLKDFKDLVEKNITEKLYSSTMLGRKRYFTKKGLYKDREEMEKEDAQIKREGFNMVIQGTAGDMTKLAMCNIFYNNPFGPDNLRLLLQVHDELILEVKEEIAEEAKEFVKQVLLDAEKQFIGYLPAEVDIKLSNEWVH